MSSLRVDHSSVAVLMLTTFLALFQPAFAQQKSAGAGNSRTGNSGTVPGNAPSGNIPTGNNGSTGNVPFGSQNSTTNPFPGTQPMTTPIFLSGVVVFDDGSPANHNIRIERVCNGQPRLEAHTDSKGRFSFQLGQNMTTDTDASDPYPGGSFGQPDSSMGSVRNLGGIGGVSRELWNCELRAAYPGYSSDTVELSMRRPMDPPDVGTIVLHHLGNVQGTTISLTAELAPKSARKDYQKGVQLAQKGKFEDAELRLKKATDLYAKYAEAWYALGQIQQRTGRGNEARRSYEAAIAADSKFVGPYQQMALLAAQAGNWEDAAKFSKQVITLDPVEYPASFWYNAVANYNLKRAAEAERSTKELLKLDTRHKFPDAENMMAQLLLDQGNYSEAATHLRNYLKLVPDAKNADNVKQILLKIEGTNTTATSKQ